MTMTVKTCSFYLMSVSHNFQMTHQRNITPFLTPSPNTPPLHEDSIQPVKKNQKQESWIWEYFIEGVNDNNELIIICQIEIIRQLGMLNITLHYVFTLRYVTYAVRDVILHLYIYQN
jgi:hypothetical protein